MEHGLRTVWDNLLKILMFHWNTGVKEQVDEEYKTYTVTLDEKFVSLLYAMFGADAIALGSFVFECFFLKTEKKGWQYVHIWSHFLGLLLCIAHTASGFWKILTKFKFVKIKN